MRIQVVGGGAIGLFVSSLAYVAGYIVTLVVRTEEQATALNNQQLVCQQLDGAIEKYPIEATTTWLTEDCLTIVTVKYHQLPTIYKKMRECSPSLPVLFVQNGLAHYEEVLQLRQKHVAFSSVQFGAKKINEFTVAQRGAGVMKVAVARGATEKFKWLERMDTDLVHVQFEQNAEEMLFQKAVLNCFINPLTAILQINNGQLLQNKEAFLLMQSLYNEIIQTFPSVGQLVAFEDVQLLCEKTATNTSSMLADRLNNRKTEVETIVGAILLRAEKEQKSMPMLQTLYGLVKAFEESGEMM